MIALGLGFIALAIFHGTYLICEEIKKLRK